MKAKQGQMSGAGLMVVGTLCAGLLLTLSTVCYLTIQEIEVPSQLETIVGGLLVGVPALLAKTYRDAQQEPTDDAQPVTVVNTVADPVPTAEAEVSAGPDGTGADHVNDWTR